MLIPRVALHNVKLNEGGTVYFLRGHPAFGFAPPRARYFLLLAQEKVPKEKGTRWLVRA